MKKVFYFLAFMLLIVAGDSSPATATSTGFCQILYNSSLGSLGYPCPPVTPAPFVNGTAGFSAQAFTNSVGVNIHLNYPQYSNYDLILRYLLAANIKHVRGGGDYLLSSAQPGEIAEYNTMAASGMKFDMGMTYGDTSQQIADFMHLVNPGVIEAIEAPNEIDQHCDSINGCVQNANWVREDQFALQQILFPNRNQITPRALVYGPSTAFSDYHPLGDLSAYEDFGNTHDYMAGFNPETVGFGGVGYGGYGYGSILYNMANAKQASLTKPIIATEFGFQISDEKQNFVPESYQGTYLLRQILQHYITGLPKSYVYELKDSGGQNFGMLRDDYSARPSFVQLAGLQNILSDSSPVSNCVLPLKVNTTGVEVMGMCKSTGEYDLILWQPVLTYDPNALTANIFQPISTPIVFNSGFTPSSLSQWSYTYTGPWTNTTSVSAGSIPVTDRPTIVVVNGPSPTPLPALPSPPPTPVPTATPVFVPTPTPAPTSTPTAVAIRQTTGNVNNDHNHVNVIATFNSSPQYGDYLLAGWAFTQFNASRYVIKGPSFMARIDPGSNEETNLTVPIACSPITDYQGYEEVCEDLWGGYVADQAYNNTNLSWVASAGSPNTSVYYDFSGADSAAPIGQIQTALAEFNTATCQGATVVRAGSQAVCIVAAKNGTVFGPGTGLSSGYTNNGWVFDGNFFADEATTYAFHYPRTTTANQVIPSFTFSDSSSFIDYSVAETVIVQPPAH